MMPSGWGLLPWPVLFVIPMTAMVVLMAIRLPHHRGTMEPGGGLGASPAATGGVAAFPPAEDPLVILRECGARGEIDLPELESRLEGLLGSEPSESTAWQRRPVTVALSRGPR